MPDDRALSQRAVTDVPILIVRGMRPRCADCGDGFVSTAEYYRFGEYGEKTIHRRKCYEYVRDALGLYVKVPLRLLEPVEPGPADESADPEREQVPELEQAQRSLQPDLFGDW